MYARVLSPQGRRVQAWLVADARQLLNYGEVLNCDYYFLPLKESVKLLHHLKRYLVCDEMHYLHRTTLSDRYLGQRSRLV